jgi:hypothetical protein
MKKIDLPASSTCWIPNGPKTPWLIALFKNKIFAGSIKIEAKGSKPRLTKALTPILKISFSPTTIGPII